MSTIQKRMIATWNFNRYHASNIEEKSPLADATRFNEFKGLPVEF